MMHRYSFNDSDSREAFELLLEAWQQLALGDWDYHDRRRWQDKVQDLKRRVQDRHIREQVHSLEGKFLNEGEFAAETIKILEAEGVLKPNA